MIEVNSKDFLDSNDQLYKEQLKGEIGYNNFPELIVPEDFQKVRIQLPSSQYGTELRNQIQPISTLAETTGFSCNIFTALYETVLNAHQHGNKLDENKKILLSHRIRDRKLELIVEDQGTNLPEYFVPFLIKLRSQTMNGDSFVNWYNFSENKKPDSNNGTGTSFMHTYMDDITYQISKNLGGLALYLVKNK